MPTRLTIDQNDHTLAAAFACGRLNGALELAPSDVRHLYHLLVIQELWQSLVATFPFETAPPKNSEKFWNTPLAAERDAFVELIMLPDPGRPNPLNAAIADFTPMIFTNPAPAFKTNLTFEKLDKALELADEAAKNTPSDLNRLERVEFITQLLERTLPPEFSASPDSHEAKTQWIMALHVVLRPHHYQLISERYAMPHIAIAYPEPTISDQDALWKITDTMTHGYDLIQAASAYLHAIKTRAGYSLPIAPHHSRILNAIASGEPIRQAQITQLAQTTSPTAARIIADLEKLQLVTTSLESKRGPKWVNPTITAVIDAEHEPFDQYLVNPFL